MLTLLYREPLGDAIEGFWWQPKPDFAHRPGQFVEIALPHENPDSRGIRREFTIASSPTESNLLIATRLTRPGSTFKRALLALQPGQQVAITFTGGDFLLPDDPREPVLLLAGGIGITPFRAMLKWLVDSGERRDIILAWEAKSPGDFVFADVLKSVEQSGVKVIRLVSGESTTWVGQRGRLEPDLIARLIADTAHRQVYVSGPEPLVQSLHRTLPEIGVPVDQIHRDEFPGYRSIG